MAGALCAAFLVFSLFPAATIALQAPARVLRDLEYASVGGKRLLLDLHLPDGAGPHPVILWVHGGAWLSGSKSGGPAIRQAARGYAVASINYRLSFEARFPAQIEDGKAAVRWLRANAGRYDLDPGRIAAWGSSAGGHLAALLGTSGGVADLEGAGGHGDESSRVQAVVDWYGPTDLLAMEAQALPCDPIDHNSVLSPESQLIGCAIQTCKERTNRASPTRYVTADDPPFLIMHGTADCLVPPLQSQGLHDALAAAGAAATLVYLPGAGHGGDDFETAEVQQRVDQFFDRHLQAPPRLQVLAAEISGKSLLVTGEGFGPGMKVVVNGEPQKTALDEQAPATKLIARKAGKRIARGQTVAIQVAAADGRASEIFFFTRPE